MGTFLPKTSIYYLKLWHRSAEMIHSRKKNSFLFWQERCDQEGETRKTKCFAVFEKWLTTEDQSSWQPKCSYPRWLSVSVLIRSFLTSSTSFSTADRHGSMQFHLCLESVFRYQAFWFITLIILTMSHESLLNCNWGGIRYHIKW